MNIIKDLCRRCFALFFSLHQRHLQTPTLTREWVVVTLCLFITCLIACIVCSSFSLAAAQTFIGLEVGEYLKDHTPLCTWPEPGCDMTATCLMNVKMWERKLFVWTEFGPSTMFWFFFFPWPKSRNSVSGTNWAYGQTVCLFIHYRKKKKKWHIQTFGRKRWTMDEWLGPRGSESKSGLCVWTFDANFLPSLVVLGRSVRRCITK